MSFHYHIKQAAALCILLLHVPSVGFSQEELKIDEYIQGKYAVRKVSNICWRPNSTCFSYIKENSLCMNDVAALAPRKLLTAKELSESIGEPVAAFPLFQWQNTDDLTILLKHSIISYHVPTGKIKKTVQLDGNADNVDVAGNLSVAFTVGNNLWVKDTNGMATPVTNNEKGITSGGTYVYREEFGTSKATFWSPRCNFLAFYENDERRIPDYPLVDYKGNNATVTTIKYPFAGGESQKVRLGIYNMATGKTKFLATTTGDEYLTNITWSPDESSIYVLAVNREQNHLVLKKFNAKTGELSARLFEESSKKYLEPRFKLYFLGNDSSFIYMSRKDGFQHMFLYKSDGTFISQIDTGMHEVVNISGFDKTFENVYFTAIEASNPLEQHLYKCNISTGARTRITREPGFHNPCVGQNGYIIDSASSIKDPFSMKVIDEQGNVITDIHTSKNPFSSYRYPGCKFVNITAADGTTKLWGCLLLPGAFDSTRKYPVIHYVYGGPQVQLVNNNWYNNVGFQPYYLASKGYIVFILDPRGSANRGLEFESATFRQLGTVEVADYLEGIKFLKQKSFVDPERIGVYGWSYGGYMAIKLMEEASDIYKAGVAGSPVTDWKYYEVMYGERYMDKPQENPEGYKTSSTLYETGKIHGKLLVLGGGLDYKTVPLNIASFLNACIDQKTQVDYFSFPGHEHGVVGIDRGYLLDKITSFMDENLKISRK